MRHRSSSKIQLSDSLLFDRRHNLLGIGTELQFLPKCNRRSLYTPMEVLSKSWTKNVSKVRRV